MKERGPHINGREVQPVPYPCTVNHLDGTRIVYASLDAYHLAYFQRQHPGAPLPYWLRTTEKQLRKAA